MKDRIIAAPKILYDGWSLVHQPNSPAALHLLTLLAAHPADFPAAVGLPGESSHLLPVDVETLQGFAPDTDWGRLGWEQRLLPALAARVEAALTHHIGGSPALFGAAPRLVSPAGFSVGNLPAARRGPGFAGRLREAFSQGGLARAAVLLWPEDLPEPATETRLRRLPPPVHPLFQTSAGAANPAQSGRAELEGLDLPETYLLAHGPGDGAGLRRLLDAWSWAAGSIGEYYPLLLVGLDRPAQDRFAALLAEYQLTDTARPLPPLSLPALAAVYHGCGALFHPEQISVWGDPARLALACGKPVVALESEGAAALMGPAGYLISAQQPYPAICRALGAALISVVVEESLADALSQAARERAAPWQLDSFSSSLRECYAAHAP
jgi:glycosyltransferase involved in cell wall biosynthesis